MKKTGKKNETLEVVNSKAAGIDIGSRSHYVAIGQECADVREFGVYSDDLHTLCKWLQSEGITAVALESTGSYWQNLFLLLQDYGLNPILVSGKFTKNVQGKKTDVQDCQWIQKLHTFGLLPNSFQPDNFTEQVRQYARHRQGLLENGADYIRKMQKALRLMNIRLDIAVSDVTGKSGQAIIKAVLEGKSDPVYLASLADGRVKKSKDELAKALTGVLKPEYVFELKQSYELWQFFQSKITECDTAIAQLLEDKIAKTEAQDGEQRPVYQPKKRKRKHDSSTGIDIGRLSYELTGGIDLSEIDGVNSQTLLAIVSEIGANVSAFATAKQFTSWLRLAPNNKKTGGKVISNRSPKKKNKLGLALLRVGHVIGNNLKSGALHHFFMRIKARSGHIEASVATARKVAVIIWNMLTKKEAYQPIENADYLQQVKKNAIRNIKKKLTRLGITLDDLVLVQAP
jgi:transposase